MDWNSVKWLTLSTNDFSLTLNTTVILNKWKITEIAILTILCLLQSLSNLLLINSLKINILIKTVNNKIKNFPIGTITFQKDRTHWCPWFVYHQNKGLVKDSTCQSQQAIASMYSADQVVIVGGWQWRICEFKSLRRTLDGLLLH